VNASYGICAGHGRFLCSVGYGHVCGDDEGTGEPVTNHTILTALTFTAPLPPKALNPNYKGHWSEKAPAAAHYRRDVALCALQAINKRLRSRPDAWQPKPSLVRVTLAFGVRPPAGAFRMDSFYRPRDIDNAIASFKAGLDGLRDAEAVSNDDHRHLELGPCTIDPSSDGVVVTVEVLKW
jgi:crossover junction endodeoxyribonuclease RusA